MPGFACQAHKRAGKGRTSTVLAFQSALKYVLSLKEMEGTLQGYQHENITFMGILEQDETA